jgi:hypothetical protein
MNYYIWLILLRNAVSCLSNITKKSNINLHPHYQIRKLQRHINNKWVYDCIIKEELVGILKQSDDKFRLYYQHPIIPKTHDLIIVVVINDLITKDITVVTSYKQTIKKRERRK